MRSNQTRSLHSVRWILVASILGALAVPTTAAPRPKKPKKPPVTKTTPKPTPTPIEATEDPKPSDKDPKAPDPKDAKDTKDAKLPSDLPATPAPPTPTDAATEPKPEASNEPDVDTLRQEYLSLRDELFKSRARANAVASQLYSTRVSIRLTYTTARYYNPAKASIRLDGASVYDDSSGGIANDDGVRFDGYVAPGRHVVTFRVEATGKDDDSFTSATETQIVVKAVAGKDLIVAAKAHDSGDIAYAWKRNERGSYGLGIDVGVKTAPHSEGGGTKPKGAAK